MGVCVRSDRDHECTRGGVFNTKTPMSAPVKESTGVNPARPILLMLLPRQPGSKGLVSLSLAQTCSNTHIHTNTYAHIDT